LLWLEYVLSPLKFAIAAVFGGVDFKRLILDNPPSMFVVSIILETGQEDH
jgi:hypothetical protein